MDDKEKLWVFKHEPTSLETYIASDVWKKRLMKIIQECPNFILAGHPGIGKSTFMNIFLKETGYDVLKINASVENGVDVMRSKIITFASSLGMTKFKIVYLNEAERLTEASQEMLRQLMEDVQEHTRFAFVCNSHNEICTAIKSRCILEEMSAPPADKIYEHCISLLKKENVQYESAVNTEIMKLIKGLYPDIRRIINSIQGSVIDNKIESINATSKNALYANILKSIFDKDLDTIRKILRNNMFSYPDLYQVLFENIDRFKSPGDAIINIAEYLYRDKTVAIQEINFMGMIVKMMKEDIL